MHRIFGCVRSLFGFADLIDKRDALYLEMRSLKRNIAKLYVEIPGGAKTREGLQELGFTSIVPQAEKLSLAAALPQG